MPSPGTGDNTDSTLSELMQLVRELVAEVQPHRQGDSAADISLDTSFEKDLGLDSLTRVELVSRVEKKFSLALPEQVLAQVDSPRDLLRAIQGAVSSKQTPDGPVVQKGVQTVVQEAALDRVSQLPDEAETLLDVLDWHAARHPERPHIRLYADEVDGEIISYAQLRSGAARVAAGLQQRGLQPAEPVVLMLPSGPEYFYSFFGILMAGGIPVPIYPPARPSQLEDHMRRHVRILRNCRASIFITVDEARKVARLLMAQVPELRHIVSLNELSDATVEVSLPRISANDIAFIQYTSGSTGNPKGVMLTHANLLSNIRAMGRVIGADSSDVFVSWLPLYHDMGLIGAWLGSLYHAALFVVMSPLSFLARPERWLRAMHRYRGTLSASPNFGYEYCLRRIDDEEIKGIDLSSWRAAFNGAEPVSVETLEGFSSRFQAYGFSRKAMTPVYGLAESTVGLAFPPPGRGPLIDTIERDRFMRTGSARPVTVEDKQALRFVSSGSPLPGHQIRIVDQAGHELPERQEGRIEFHGPSATSGYYRDAERTARLFDGEWLDSGDLGYMANAELYVTGRIKDIIIRAGRNIYPHELEEAVGNIPGIRTGRVAVFGSEDRQGKTERLVVMAETRSHDKQLHENLRKQINTLATDLIGSPPDEVVLAPPGTILKTSSGKIRRAASRELYEQGRVGKKQAGVYLQVARVALAGLLPQARRGLRYARSLLFASWSWSAYGVLAAVAWSAVMFLPGFALRWSIAAACARLFARVTATPLSVDGLENIPAQGQPCVLVCNHASYLDGYALIAALPRRFHFVAKKELADSFFSRIPLQRIHTEFVDRFETGKSLRDTQQLVETLKAGNALIFFAEGTFTRVPGLRPFMMGAFVAAARAEVPVIPVAIRGTRSILRAGSWFPHHGAISIHIGRAIEPGAVAAEASEKGRASDEWHTAIALRERSREYILRHCGEPDLLKR